MKEQRPEWSESLSSSPFMKPRFSEQMEQEIIKKVKQRKKSKISFYRLFPAMAILIFIGAALLITFPKMISEQGLTHTSEGMPDPWKVRAKYQQNGKTLFNIYPDPNLSAGKTFGYMIHFTQPFEIFAGKQISIYAYHKETNTRIIALPPQTITEPSPGYSGLERFTAMFELPLSGIWRYEVYLDGQFYGDAVLSVAEPSWSVSPTFELPYTDKDGKEHKYVLVGEKEKAGFIAGHFVAGKSNKYMWHFWGADNELEGEFKVLAVKQGTNNIVNVFSAANLAGGLNRADRTLPSNMSLPEPGAP